MPLPLSPVVGEEWGVDEEAMQLQALVSQLQHHAATIAHTAFTHAHTTTTTLLGPTCSRVVHSTAIAPAQIGQEAHQAVEGGVQVGMPQDNQTSKSISKGASPKPQPVWKVRNLDLDSQDRQQKEYGIDLEACPHVMCVCSWRAAWVFRP